MKKLISHPYAMLTLVALIWGANAVAGKLAVGHVSPMMLTLLRWIVACAVLTPFAWSHARHDWPMIRPRLPLLIALGIFGFSVFNALFYLALTYTSALNVVIEQASMPLVVFALSFVLFRTAVTRWQMIGFVVTITGVAVTASHGDLSALASLQLNRGDALMLLAVLLYAGFTVGIRAKPPIHWLSLIFVLSLSALVSSVPLAAVEAAYGGMILPDSRGWAIVVFAALLPSIVSQSLYVRAIELIGANRANLFTNLTPIFGAILAILVVGEKPYPYHAVALGLVLGGIVLAERRSAREEVEASPGTL
ncbi:membrane protein [Aureimonas sp. SA4125]|uniref:DMT family transporter n=1 Tax=Aureimonas sp. SA4125 TaxID=2826993 RepID=UPI001CC51102|nr:DMT family transporter [Aureimonas sp. SA4125]BDA83242.1 membrane protein [Aureimonas sp. SA4125]